MKKQNLIILIIAIFLFFVAAVLVLNQGKGTFGNKQKEFAITDTASITKVFLADKNNRTILLERQPDGDWLLNGTYKARSSGINMLFETFVNLVPKYPVPKKAHNNVISQLAVKSTKVEIYQKVNRINIMGLELFPHEKLTKTYYVGDATPDNMGTFMLMDGQEIPFVVHLLGFRGFVAPRYSTLEKEWRDHTVFREKVNVISSILMEFPLEPENSFKVINDKENIKLYSWINSEPLAAFDTLKLLNFMTAFNDIRYEALLDDIDPSRKDSIIKSSPKYIITLINTKKDTTSIKVFYKPNDDMQYDMDGNIYFVDLDRAYALINKDRDFVLIQYFVFDKILKPLSFFQLNQ